MNRAKVLVSILNWNNSEKTLACIASLFSDTSDCMNLADIIVVDNGSLAADFANLQAGLGGTSVLLHQLNKNIGFTGGHNISAQRALVGGYDHLWLLNNDAIVEAGVLEELLAVMQEDTKCGAASPVIRATHDRDEIDACGAIHDWESLSSMRASSIAEAAHFQQTRLASMWVPGTAVLLRVQALRLAGVLDDHLFAYYDDNDICARLLASGWHSKMVFNATVLHDCYNGLVSERPAYYFYLMQRNELIFWYKNTPLEFRQFLWLKLVNRALFNVNRLYRRNLGKKADAALLGIWDFIGARYGAPELNRTVPMAMKFALHFSSAFYARKLKKLQHASPMRSLG